MNNYVFVIFVAIIAVASGSRWLQTTGFKSLRVMEGQTCDSSTTYKKCVDDTSLEFCLYGNLYRGNCPNDQPICDIDKCVARGSVPFKCPATDGYYPDLYTCTSFHYCSGSKATSYDCSAISSTSVYDPNTQSCIYGDPEKCTKISCTGKNFGDLVPYALDKAIYIVCGSNDVPMSPGRCPQYTTFDTTSNNCGPTCWNEGRIPKDSTISSSFYDCVYKDDTNKEFLRVEGTCPTGLLFDPEKRICVKS